jgi:hypothetical protein
MFSEIAGRPDTVILSGRSQGGLVTRIVTDAAPAWLDGAVPMCGGGAGAISMWNTKLDSAFALRELVDPDSQMSITRIQDERREQAAMNELVARATATDHGQARIVLAAALSKIPAVDAETGEDVPATDLDKRIAEYTDAMPFALGIGVRAGFEQTIGGAFSWNDGVDYRKELKASGRWPEVQRAYREAGADLEADLQTLADAPRITADQAHYGGPRGCHCGGRGICRRSTRSRRQPRSAPNVRRRRRTLHLHNGRTNYGNPNRGRPARVRPLVVNVRALPREDSRGSTGFNDDRAGSNPLHDTASRASRASMGCAELGLLHSA